MLIRIAIIESHPLYIKGILEVFQRYPDIEMTGTYSNVEALLTGLEQEVPAVLLFGTTTGLIEWGTLLKVLMQQYPAMRIIAFANRGMNIM